MAGLEDQISSLLSDPEGMSRLKSMAESLFGSEGAPPAKAAEPSLPIDPAAISRIATLLKPSGEDDRIRLLLALRPHLTPDKPHRLDSAVKMIRLLQLAPKLGELGLFEV